MTIKLQTMTDDIMERGPLRTFQRGERLGASFGANWLDQEPFADTVKESTHAIHEFSLSGMSILVAYDPETSTLYITEKLERGYVENAVRKAWERGERNPYLAELDQAYADRDSALYETRKIRAAWLRLASIAMDGVERLKSRKPGVRRRAKRLLAKLGKTVLR